MAIVPTSAPPGPHPLAFPWPTPGNPLTTPGNPLTTLWFLNRRSRFWTHLYSNYFELSCTSNSSHSMTSQVLVTLSVKMSQQCIKKSISLSLCFSCYTIRFSHNMQESHSPLRLSLPLQWSDASWHSVFQVSIAS